MSRDEWISRSRDHCTAKLKISLKLLTGELEMIQLAYDVLDTKGNAVSSCRRFHRTLFDEATIISLFERERERGNKEAERAPSCAENRKIDNSLLYGQKHSFDESKWKGHPAHGKTQRCAIYSKNVARHGVAELKQKKMNFNWISDERQRAACVCVIDQFERL